MFRILAALFLGVFFMASINISHADENKTNKPGDKPGVILVAFGTSIPEARKVFDFIEKDAKKMFPGYDIKWGFTARSIVETLRKEKRDHGVLTLEEAIAAMKKSGYKKVILQSLHVSPGQKDAELKKADTLGMKAVYGAPLLNTPEDIAATLKAVKDEINPKIPNVFAGHGNDHHPEYNAAMIDFNKVLHKEFPNAWLCSVEGKPGTDALTKEIKPAVKKAGNQVKFIPLMIVAGDHIMNDVKGDEEDSWKSILGVEKPELSKPLGYNTKILAIFWQHLNAALQQK